VAHAPTLAQGRERCPVFRFKVAQKLGLLLGFEKKIARGRHTQRNNDPTPPGRLLSFRSPNTLEDRHLTPPDGPRSRLARKRPFVMAVTNSRSTLESMRSGYHSQGSRSVELVTVDDKGRVDAAKEGARPLAGRRRSPRDRPPQYAVQARARVVPSSAAKRVAHFFQRHAPSPDRGSARERPFRPARQR